MTVKELKKALRGVPDDVEVVALKDGVYCEQTDVWGAGFDDYIDKDEDGYEEEIRIFTLNC
jgi:hypothetical protein